eukprot:CAMPEP_0196584024 /NCGR_PEP_ID=MMETSP1081-20130531/45507_1 /TAXON_ID=36882 /ORGANISM="Pyramimonas amylifera, Strain CCMP720" /LENGTH=301 /DNA_ID=CAMNT_0041905097 /DNA_START=174 /DNA_END=1076 /DNA_ORIENTATION=+
MYEGLEPSKLDKECQVDVQVGKRPRILNCTDVSSPASSPANTNANSLTTTTSPTTSSLPANSASDLEFRIEAACSEDKGRRTEMEDTWVIESDARRESNSHVKCMYMGVFDGHGGRHAADFVAEHLHVDALSQGLLPTTQAPDSDNPTFSVADVKKAIQEAFKKTDAALLAKSSTHGWQDGATAVCLWVLEQRTAFVANVGDAKAVLARAAGPSSAGQGSFALKALTLTKEHKAIFAPERARIEKAGGQVTEGRLQGRVEVSRSFGDRVFKKVGMSASPDIRSFKLSEADKFIVLGCDGFW